MGVSGLMAQRPLLGSRGRGRAWASSSVTHLVLLPGGAWDEDPEGPFFQLYPEGLTSRRCSPRSSKGLGVGGSHTCVSSASWAAVAPVGKVLVDAAPRSSHGPPQAGSPDPMGWGGRALPLTGLMKRAAPQRNPESAFDSVSDHRTTCPPCWGSPLSPVKTSTWGHGQSDAVHR